MILQEGYSTPDTVFFNDKELRWRDSDAYPFFLLKGNKIVYGNKSRTHKEYYEGKYSDDKGKLTKFIESIIIQGRYWKNSNVFSFWYINEVDNTTSLLMSLISRVLSDFKKPIDGCYVAYKGTLNKLMNDDGRLWLKEISDDGKENTELSQERYEYIDKWFKSDKQFVENAYRLKTRNEKFLMNRELNSYEVLAATCYQMWADFVLTKKISAEELSLYVSLEYKRVSFNELIDYFFKNMRNKIANMHDKNSITEFDYEDAMEEFLDSVGFDSGEYSVVYYEGTNKAYSYNIKTTDVEKVVKAIELAKENDFDVTRCFKRKINDEEYIAGFRLREKYKMENKTFGKKIKITEGQEKLLISEAIKIHKGENGRKYSTQGKWDKEIECSHCNERAFFSMSISDGNKGRGRIKVTNEDGIEEESEVQTIALYYCPHCYRFIARNNMA